MIIWVINPYGNLPYENWRVHRSWLVSKAFHLKGHSVKYWISNIDHRSKKIRRHDSSSLEDITIEIVSSTTYNSHISFKRIFFERNFIKNFILRAEKITEKPDLIIIGEPSLFVSFNFIKFQRKFNIKFVIDFVDLWPELFIIILPNFLKPLHKIIFSPFYLKRSWFIKQCNGLVASCNMYLNIAKSIYPNVNSHLSYLGVDSTKFNSTVKNYYPQSTFNLIYAGTLGRNYDIDLIIEVAKLCKTNNLNVHIFIAGDGEMKNFLINSVISYNLNNVTYLGMINPSELLTYYNRCHLALSTYSKESTVAMPIKAFDYFAAGLPLLNSLGSDLGDMINIHFLGLNYESGNLQDIFNKIVYLKNNFLLINKMSTNCLEISKKFNESHIYSEYVEFCEKVILL